MKRFLFIVAMGLMAISAQAQQSKMLYIVDGKVVSKSDVDALQPDKIKNMNVMKGVDAVTVINTKGGDVQTIVVKKDGSVSSSSTGGSNFTSTSTTTVNGKTETLEVKGLVGKPVTVRTSGTSGEPLTLVRIDSGEIAKGSTNNIKADMIKSVSVIKASEKCDEFKQWGDVSNGVVFIDLKDGYTFDDIKNRYSERVFSRIVSNYKPFKIIGTDIRLK